VADLLQIGPNGPIWTVDSRFGSAPAEIGQSLPPSLSLPVAETLTKLAYQTLQQGKGLMGLAHKEISTRLMTLLAPDGSPRTEPVPPQMLAELRRSMDRLIELDWQEAEADLYPTALLFDAPWLDWAARYPLVWLDMPATWNRRRERNVRDLPRDVSPDAYPDYYLQNFHHQTDGYLSDHSASLYDLQVEILFNGTADPMRRRIIKPLRQALQTFAERPASAIRVLDVATGTGRTLRQLRGALPQAQLVGLDLSRAYLRQANRWLSQLPGELPQLVQGNAEAMPFADGCFQAISCVFLLHELPAQARQHMIDEAFRLLEPGGVLLLADSVQLEDSPEFRVAMENFRRVFHEPYYRDYIGDRIDERLQTAGFEAVTAESHFMTRIWSARKPR
jgi:ubiquinone/menaquinone biosynthesis C-methylase UbiE